MHKPDYSKERFKIIITVNENCQSTEIQCLNGTIVTYQEVIGALETMKLRYVFNQTVINIEEYMKWKAAKEKEESEIKTNADVK